MNTVPREELLQRLQSGKPGTIAEAAEELGLRLDSSPAVLDALEVHLRNPEPFVRRTVATAIGRLGASASGLGSALMERFTDTAVEVRVQAALSYFQVSGRWQEAVPVLRPVLAMREADCAIEALTAIAKGDKTAALEMRDLLTLLEWYVLDCGNPRFESVEVQRAAAVAIVAIDPDQALERFARLLSREGRQHAEAIASALGEVGAPAIPLFFRMLREGPFEARSHVLWSLGKMASPTDEVIATMARELASPDERCRRIAIANLKRWGPRAIDAEPDLRAIIHAPSPWLRLEARDALKAITGETIPPEPVDPNSWEGVFQQLVLARHERRNRDAAQLLSEARKRLAKIRTADYAPWMKEALQDPYKKWFVADLFATQPLPKALLRSFVAAAVQERDASNNNSFVRPCVETYGSDRVRALLQEYLDSGTEAERAGAERALYWCMKGRPKRGIQSQD